MRSIVPDSRVPLAPLMLLGPGAVKVGVYLGQPGRLPYPGGQLPPPAAPGEAPGEVQGPQKASHPMRMGAHTITINMMEPMVTLRRRGVIAGAAPYEGYP